MAGKIFVTGDTHREFRKLNTTRFPQQRNLDKEDYVIICGDFGLVWDIIREERKPWEEEEPVPLSEKKESREEAWWLDWLERLPFTVLFVDGNHENFDRLYKYPVEEWHGGKVHKIRPSVIHLMRGQVFKLAGKKIFTFGGAASHDISDGILEVTDPDIKQKIKDLEGRGALFRINHVSWWKEEMPSEAEMEEGLENLAKHGNKVDYIISHCCPGQVQPLIDERLDEQNELTDYFDSVRLGVEYEKWYFGHYHLDKTVTPKEVLLYHRVIELGEEVDDVQPVLGKPRYEMYQPVKFQVQIKDVQEEKIGIVAIRDAYGTFSDPDEPSYDIFAMYGDEVCLFKHHPESTVKALTQEELKEHAELISKLATGWGRKG